MSKTFWPTALLLSVTAIWGFTFVTNQQVMESMSAVDLLTIRFGLATFVMIALKPHWLWAAPREHYVHGFWLGLALCVGYLVQLVGLQHTSATASGFVTGMFVVFTPLLSAVLLRTRITWQTWLAVLLTVIGLGLLALNGGAIGFGELLTLLCALLFALHIIGLDKWSDAQYVYSLSTTQIGTVFLFSFVVSVFQGGPHFPANSMLWLQVAFIAVFATCLGFFAQTWVQSHLSATRTAIILTMEPVFSALAGVTIGTDQVSTRMIIGAALILGAMYLVELGPRQSAEGRHVHLEP